MSFLGNFRISLSATLKLKRSLSRKKHRANLHTELCVVEEQEIDLTQYEEDPIGFAELLGVSLTPQQQQIVISVRDNRETNVQSCHGVGKTYCGSFLVIWFVFAVEGRVITTAPTDRQVVELLWKEINKLHSRNRKKLGGECLTYKLKYTDDAEALGFAAANADLNTSQGFHHKKLLVIQDEACGISTQVDEGLTSTLTGDKNRILRIGNPVASQTPFYYHCNRKKILINAWGHPNTSWAYQKDLDGMHRLKPEVREAITDLNGEILPQGDWVDSLPKDVVPGAISVNWIEDRRADKGEGSLYWQTRIEAKFPEDNVSSVIPYSYFLAARARYDADPEYWEKQFKYTKAQFGLDVGDGGADHALSRWKGDVLYSVELLPTKGDRYDTMRAAELILSRIDKEPYPEECGIAVDCIGVGAGTLAIIMKERPGNRPKGINWGMSGTKHVKDFERFVNVKAEQFWTLRMELERGEIAIAPLGKIEDRVAQDLANTHYLENPSGKIQIEPKQKTVERLGRNPDAGDAVVFGRFAKRRRYLFET